MNTTIKVLTLGACLFSAFSCSDSFFDKAPTGALDKGKVNNNNLTELLNGAYQYNAASWDGYSAAFLDGYADNGYSRNLWDSPGNSVQSNTLTADKDFSYSALYGGIRACNNVLSFAEKSDGPDKAKIIAEARMLRAFLYADLTLRFGDIAIIKEVANDYPDGLKRNKASEVRKFVLSEIDAAIQDLPEQNIKPRYTKAKANAVKARVAYYFGDYAVAEQAAKYVIEHGGYHLHTASDQSRYAVDAAYFKKLYTQSGLDVDKLIKGIFNYQDLWTRDDSPEVILATEHDATIEKSSWMRITCFLSPGLTTKHGWATIVPIQQLVDAYWMVDGKTKPQAQDHNKQASLFKDIYQSTKTKAKANSITPEAQTSKDIDEILKTDFMKQYFNRDPRLYASIIFPFSSVDIYKRGEYSFYEHTIDNYGKSGYYFRKFSSPDQLIARGAYFYTGVDWPVMRLAEIYLIYAESHTQTTGYDAEAQKYLNMLRDRVGMAHVPSTLSKNEALDFIRNERRIELAGEGLRFYDIRLYEDDTRNGGYKGLEAASNVMKGQIFDVINNPGALLVWDKRLELLPYPTSALDKNKNKESKENNPGY